MEFEINYLKLLADKKQNLTSLSEDADRLITSLDVSDKWIEAMAVCEAALDAGLLDDKILALRKEMFFDGRELHSVANLNSEDYAAWFNTIINLNKKFADAGVAEAWAELGSLYFNARTSHQSFNEYEKCMLKGIELEDPLAMSLYGYHMYSSLDRTEDIRQKALDLMNRAKEKNFDRAKIYLLICELDTGIDPAAYVQKIEDYNSTAEPCNQLWSVLGDVYSDKLDNVEKSIEAYNKGIEMSGSPYCKYKKAIAIMNGITEGSIDDAISMLEAAYEWNVIHAADFLGQYYSFDEKARDIAKAIEWYKKAIAYGSQHSMLNLSLIYLYNDKHADTDEGFACIDMAIEDGNTRAMCEKAYFMLESGEENKNVPAAKKLLEQAYDAGDGYAAYRLGYGYQIAEFADSCDYETAFKYYCAGAERGNINATELAGRYSRMGFAGEPDPVKTVEYYRKAIEMGSKYAKTELASCYETGFGVPENYDRALELLNEAANENDPRAHTRLGYHYISGIHTAPDYSKAFGHFSKAADAGDPAAMYELGRMYKYSIGRPENSELALKFFKKAASCGDPDANIEMGLSYESEYGGVEFDGEKAIQHMSAAAELNHPFALYKLGIYYYYGLTEQDIDKGVEYLKKAYDNGSPYASATLGDYFIYGHNDGDASNAFNYYSFAAENDHITEGIGLCYQFGIGVEQSDAQAFKYYSIAAERHNTAAKFRLGMCHKNEIGTVKNLAEAYRYLAMAAEEGHRTAQYEAAMMLINGDGVPVRMDKGMEWLARAAEQEQDDAQLELGNCYLTGRGVEEDEIQAMYWYQKAAENGNEHAQKITGRRDRSRR
jgi:TPR repeat protein